MAIKTVTLYLNGQSYDIPLDSSTGKYVKTIAAPSQSSWDEADHKYEMQLEVADVAGNVTTVDKSHSTFGAGMLLRVLEKTPPVIVITKPSSGAYIGSNSVDIEFTVTDTESGVNPDTITIQIDSTGAISEGITKAEIEGGYKCTYTTSIPDGEHTVKVNASDNDGNAAVEKQSVFTVDTIPPELNITSPPAALITNQQKVTVEGTTNDEYTIAILLNGTSQGTVTQNADYSFSKDITLTKGENVIVIKATDKAGKLTTVTREVTYDPVAPVIVSIDIAPNPVDAGAEFVVTVEATDS